jgi:hypothetical protein
MKSRCSNPNNNRFANYGGRGISVCDEWNKFESFYLWSVLNGYVDNLTIDRKDTNGNYEPDNCRWVTEKVQQNNRSNNRYVEFDGVSHTLGEWSEITGIKLATIWARLNNGWSTEKTLTTEPYVGANQYGKVV